MGPALCCAGFSSPNCQLPLPSSVVWSRGADQCILLPGLFYSLFAVCPSLCGWYVCLKAVQVFTVRTLSSLSAWSCSHWTLSLHQARLASLPSALTPCRLHSGLALALLRAAQLGCPTTRGNKAGLWH